jgi:hypothetical protein
MSYPPIGFPDYSRLTPTGGRYLATLSGEVSTNPATEPISSTGFGYLTLITIANGVTANYLVIVNWGANSDPSVRFTTSQYVPNNDNENVVNFQILGEWFTVEYLYISGTATDTPKTLIYATNAIEIGSPLGNFGSQYINETAAITANTTEYYEASGCYGGSVWIGVSNLIGQQWYCQVQQYDPSTAAWVTLYQIGGSSYGFSAVQEVSLPPAPTRIAMTNTESSTVSYTVTMVAA